MHRVVVAVGDGVVMGDGVAAGGVEVAVGALADGAVVGGEGRAVAVGRVGVDVGVGEAGMTREGEMGVAVGSSAERMLSRMVRRLPPPSTHARKVTIPNPTPICRTRGSGCRSATLASLR